MGLAAHADGGGDGTQVQREGAERRQQQRGTGRSAVMTREMGMALPERCTGGAAIASGRPHRAGFARP